jgi:hypothetical protein
MERRERIERRKVDLLAEEKKKKRTRRKTALDFLGP